MSSGQMIEVSEAARSGAHGRSLLSAVQDAFLVVISALFAYVHIHLVVVEGVFTSAPFAMINITYAVLFLTRRRSNATSTRWQDWLVAAIGGWLPFACQPDGSSSAALATVGTAVQAVGLVLAVICLTSLGRSFGIVAADRGLKTGGAYALVRHPIYSAHLITQAGFLMANPSVYNGVLLAIVATAQVLRIGAEERLLEASSDYAAYKSSVRYRLVPGLY